MSVPVTPSFRAFNQAWWFNALPAENLLDFLAAHAGPARVDKCAEEEDLGVSVNEIGAASVETFYIHVAK